MDVKLNTYPTPDFKARLISKAYIKGTTPQSPIELYSLHSSDRDFCAKLLNKLDLKKLYPEQKDYDGFGAWDTIIRHGIFMTGIHNVILAVQNNRPCGVMSYNEEENEVHLGYLAKWRPKPKEDVSYVGKVLMHHLFDYTHREGAWNISLIASSGTPRGKDCRDFYLKMGFRRSANNTMNLFAADYAQKSKQLEDLFEYEEIKNSPNINPSKQFNITYKDTLWEKLQKLVLTLRTKLY